MILILRETIYMSYLRKKGCFIETHLNDCRDFNSFNLNMIRKEVQSIDIKSSPISLLTLQNKYEQSKNRNNQIPLNNALRKEKEIYHFRLRKRYLCLQEKQHQVLSKLWEVKLPNNYHQFSSIKKIHL